MDILNHNLDISVSIGSVALGASIIEKHLTLDRSLGGPDATFSLESDEFRAMVKSVREVEKAWGESPEFDTCKQILGIWCPQTLIK